jgi:RHS repeat-associated protein
MAHAVYSNEQWADPRQSRHESGSSRAGLDRRGNWLDHQWTNSPAGTPVPHQQTRTANNVNEYTQLDPQGPGDPPNPPAVTPTYDLDGNMTSDGSFLYTWDAENRLTSVTPKPALAAGSKRLVFTYDYMNRRVRKRVYAHTGSGWPTTPSEDSRFVYDGWNVLLVLDGLNANAVVRRYTWGLDLSDTLHSAGGIGGLLAAQEVAPLTDCLYLYDGNGNVGQVLDAEDGSIVAKYEYDPYGNTLVSAGTYASGNPFRFSTKYADDETGLYYYGYRYYTPRLGRWLSRDPIGENGGWNVHAFVVNLPTSVIDKVGMCARRGQVSISDCPDDTLTQLEQDAHHACECAAKIARLLRSLAVVWVVSREHCAAYPLQDWCIEQRKCNRDEPDELRRRRNDIAAVLEKMAARCAEGGYDVECVSACTGRDPNEPPDGYVPWYSDTIHVCPQYFQGGITWNKMFHEMTHSAGGTKDVADEIAANAHHMEDVGLSLCGLAEEYMRTRPDLHF